MNKDLTIKPKGPLSSKSSAKPVPTGIPVGTKLVFYRQTKNGQEKTAEGKWNAEENKWDFTGEDDSLTDWLTSSFSQPIVGRAAATSPNMTIRQNTMAYVYHMRDVIMPRKNVVMKVEGA